jgi:hypothetical protein
MTLATNQAPQRGQTEQFSYFAGGRSARRSTGASATARRGRAALAKFLGKTIFACPIYQELRRPVQSITLPLGAAAQLAL